MFPNPGIAQHFACEFPRAQRTGDEYALSHAATSRSFTLSHLFQLCGAAGRTYRARVQRDPAWNDDDLADDVATLSYERALRTHNRYKPADTGDRASAQAADSRSCRTCGALPSHAAPVAQAANLPAEPRWNEDAEPQSAPGVSTIFDQNRKCASITIRLSKAEGEQLRRRAAEAGLTVSAYLRSCTFEAEALRAQVKEVLAELRKTSSTEKQSAKTAIRRSWFEWLWRLMPQWHTGQRIARA